jgi:superfamily II DNA or RNA helicase
MSVFIPNDKLSEHDYDNMINDLIVEEKTKFTSNKYSNIKKSIECCFSNDTGIYLPFNYTTNILNMPFNEDKNYNKINLRYNGSLREEQKIVKDELLQSFNQKRCGLLAAYPGFGKTRTALYLASLISLKTLIVTHRESILDQWKKTINLLFGTDKIHILSSKDTCIPNDTEFSIASVNKLRKIEPALYNDFGFAIFDEAHILCSIANSQSLFRVQPRYLLALTATPNRSDGLDKILDLHFGKERIYRKLYTPHKVYKINTSFVPEVKYTFDGSLDWNSVLEFQCDNKERNDVIMNLVSEYKDRCILILCKRKSQTNYLYEQLKLKNESVDKLIGSDKKYNYDARILLSTYSKTGVGFDHPKLDTLIIASDVESLIEQYHGRIFRKKEVDALVLDLVDDHYQLKNHYRTREKYYISTGGSVVVKKLK